MSDATFSLTATSLHARPALDPPMNKRLVRGRAVIAFCMLAPVAIAAAASPVHAIEGTWGALACNILGWLLFFLGGGLRWWSTLYIGHQKTRRLICDGPYSLCRNPIYLGNFLLALSCAAFLQSLTLALWLFPVGAVYLWNTVRNEEDRLYQAFGETYLQYCRVVPRFVPKFSNYVTRPALRLYIWGMGCEFKRSLRWMWIPILSQMVLHFRSVSLWPPGYWLP